MRAHQCQKADSQRYELLMLQYSPLLNVNILGCKCTLLNAIGILFLFIESSKVIPSKQNKKDLQTLQLNVILKELNRGTDVHTHTEIINI